MMSLWSFCGGHASDTQLIISDLKGVVGFWVFHGMPWVLSTPNPSTFLTFGKDASLNSSCRVLRMIKKH
ncbi:MAG: hypothetical protein Q8P67_00585, partial [archaeon]|nr:hypothetical protein [archaeon]